MKFPCPTCHRAGTLPKMLPSGIVSFTERDDCRTCNKEGWIEMPDAEVWKNGFPHPAPSVLPAAPIAQWNPSLVVPGQQPWTVTTGTIGMAGVKS